MHLQNALFYLHVSKFCIQPSIFFFNQNKSQSFLLRRTARRLPVDVNRGEKHWTFHLPGKKKKKKHDLR